ncbi:MAG: SIS domain-containing protein [Pseudomonadota bacterium]
MLNRIDKTLTSLSSAEQRVADWVLQHPHLLVENPLSKVAQAVGVSEPTVVRFCRSMGTQGFRDFKVRVAQNLATQQHTIHADLAADDNTTDVITKVIGRSVRELNGVQQRLNPQTINAVAHALSKVSRIDFYGVGASGIVVADAQNKFFRLGIPCNCHTDHPTMAQAAAITDNSYGVIGVSKTGETKSVVEACKLAKKNGATVITIASPLSSLAAAGGLSVLVDVDEDTGVYTPMSSRLAQLAVLDVIQVTLALKLGLHGTQKLDLAKAALKNTKDIDSEARHSG